MAWDSQASSGAFQSGATGAMTGFAVGGAPGAIIGGLAGGLYGWLSGSEADKTKKELRDRLKEQRDDLTLQKKDIQKFYTELTKFQSEGIDIEESGALDKFLASSYDIHNVGTENIGGSGLVAGTANVRLQEAQESNLKDIQNVMAGIGYSREEMEFETDSDRARALQDVDDALYQLDTQLIEYG
jgi:hypothetical protein